MTDIIELAEKCGLKIVENLHGVKIVVAMVDNYAGHITLEELQAFADAIRQDSMSVLEDEKKINGHWCHEALCQQAENEKLQLRIKQLENELKNCRADQIRIDEKICYNRAKSYAQFRNHINRTIASEECAEAIRNQLRKEDE